ncbi:MAG: hypothetical protein GXP50_04950 [Deltaproteobacteria bacterium]|nr:hypothetical protein [Deltaproteobacteria bacterium]
MRVQRSFGPAFFFALLASLLLLAGCGSQDSGGPPPAPSAPSATGGDTGDTGDSTSGRASVAASASVDRFTAGDATGATITATVKDAAGDPLEGVEVSFSTDLGVLDGGTTSATKTTGSDGTASVVLTATEAGSARVRATAEGLTRSVTVTVEPGPVASLTLSADASTATADGASTVQLTATAKDSYGNPSATGSVAFSVDLGTFEGTNGAQTTTAPLVNGVAVVTLVAPTSAGTATVSAKADNDTADAADDVAAADLQIEFTTAPPAELGSYVLTASGTEFGAGECALFTLAASDVNGSAIRGEAVTFTTDGGGLFLDGCESTGGSTSLTTATDLSGKARAYLRVPTVAGTVWVSAASAEIGGFDRTSVTVVAVAPDASGISVRVLPANLTADGTSQAQGTVEVRDAYGNPVDTTVNLTVTDTSGNADPDLGLVSPAQVTVANGVGTFTYTAGATAGTARITAKTPNEVTASADVTLIDVPVGAVALTASSSSLVADGSSLVTLTAQVTDDQGNPVAAGTTVSFSTDLGTLVDADGAGVSSAETDGLGRAVVYLKAGTLLGTATVRATAGGATDTTTVALVPGPADEILILASPTSLVADGTQTSTLRVVVLDADNHRVADGTPAVLDVSVDASGDPEGALSSYSAETSDGEFSVTYTAPVGAGDGTARVSVQVGTATAGVDLTLSGEVVKSVSLEVGSGSLTADGASSTTVDVQVRNTLGQPVADGTTVTLTATSGSFVPTGPYTTVNGGVAVSYVAGTSAGPVVITAGAGGVSQSASLTLEPGPVASLGISPSLSRIPPDGATPSVLTITAKDAQGNPVDLTVNVNTTLGVLWTDDPTSPVSSVALVNGEGTVNLTADGNGTATVSASADGLLATEDVEVGFTSSGDPANILLSLSQETVSVAGVGEDEVATLNITVVDEGGNPITDTPNNVTVEIVEGPNGGEEIAGAALGSSATLSTTNGRVSADFRSGTVPGTVRIKVTVGTLTATSPRITVLAGPPFSVTLGRSNNIQDNGDGTLSHSYFALVSDQYGNAVADGTAVYFGQVYNDKASGSTGKTQAGTDGFEDSSADFSAAGVDAGDTLILLSGAAKGGYVVESVASSTVLDLFSTLAVTETGISYVVGNQAGGGTLASLTSTTDGKATATMTYPGSLVNDPVWVYAETAGRTVGDAAGYFLAWVAPTLVNVIGPDEGNAGDTLSFTVQVTDSASPAHYPIEALDLTVSATDGTVNPSSLTTSGDGTASFTWTVPAGAASGDSFTITVIASDGTQTTHDVTVP